MEVKHDLYNIANRIKSISPDYFIEYKGGEYSLHTKRLRPTYILTFPYKTLDQRALTYTLKTRVQNLDRLIKEIDQENQRLIAEQSKNTEERLYEAVDQALSTYTSCPSFEGQ